MMAHVERTTPIFKLKTKLLKSSLSHYNDAYIVAKGKITINREGYTLVALQTEGKGKGVIFKICAPFPNVISETNDTHIDNAKYLNVVMPMYKLIEYNDSYSKTSENCEQYYKGVRNDPNSFFHLNT